MQKEEKIRENLAKLYNNQTDQRYQFMGTFVRFGHSKRNPSLKTAVFKDIYLIKDNGKKEFVTDHLWIVQTKKFKNFLSRIKNRYNIKLKNGDKVYFQAFIDEYFKEGKDRFFKDYRIGSIRHIELEREKKLKENNSDLVSHPNFLLTQTS